MIYVIRGSLMVLAAVSLAACGGGDGGEQTEQATAGPAPAAQAAAKKGGDLTLADAERVGFVRTEPKAFEMIGAVDGAGGTMGGGKVEIYAYAGEVPAKELEDLRSTAIPAFGWKGFCHVRNLTMVYENAEACRALRRLD